jgi:hydroxysqualene synthase
MPTLTKNPGQALPIRGIDHYENFPVASLLCPPSLRPAIAAIYYFARTADDIADEGDAPPDLRLVELARYRADLEHVLAGRQTSPTWQPIFEALARAVAKHALPTSLLHDLISAFEQDVRYTALHHRYRDMEELLAYCTLSANPVGRLLLHLYGIDNGHVLAQSDHICSALQLINFWQDISVDLPRHRHYLPSDCLKQHQVAREDFISTAEIDAATQAARVATVASLCGDARDRMRRGAPLVHQIPGRAGWELRLVVQGGLRILDKIEACGYKTWEHRPTVGKFDAPVLLWRALWMR